MPFTPGSWGPGQQFHNSWEETHNMAWANAASRRSAAKTPERVLARRNRLRFILGICAVGGIGLGIHLGGARHPDHSAIADVWVMVGVLVAALIFNELLIGHLRSRLRRQGAGVAGTPPPAVVSAVSGEAPRQELEARRCPRCGEALHLSGTCRRCGLGAGWCTNGHAMPLSQALCPVCQARFYQPQEQPAPPSV